MLPEPRPVMSSASSETAVLLVNLGTPDAPEPAAVRRYLAEFLADPRVVELPRLLWLPILYGAILPLRSRRSAHAYRRIWTPQGSPLRVLSGQLCDALAGSPELAGSGAEVRLAMRYGRPSIPEVLRALKDRGLRRLLVLPLYPQYSATSTASVFDAVMRELGRWRHVPELRLIGDYHDEPAWVGAVADSIRAAWQAQGRGQRLLFSFHGIPQRYVDAGDPYDRQCRRSAALVAARLALRDDEWELSFQSRVGGEAWLTPYTEERVRDLARAGLRELDVVCPGFAVDCLETLEEIAMQNAEYFVAAGGARLRYLPALNAGTAHVDALATLLRRHLGGWSAQSEAR
jgi:ferrochelatase